MASSQPSGPGGQTPLTEWPAFPFPASIAAAIVLALAVLVLLASSRLDATGGLLTISIMVVAAFISVTFTVMLYPTVPQTPLVDILIGGLATSLGAVVAFWMSGGGRK